VKSINVTENVLADALNWMFHFKLYQQW